MSQLTAEKNAVLAVYAATSQEGKTLLEGLFGAEALKGNITDRVNSLEDAYNEIGLVINRQELQKVLSPFQMAAMDWEVLAKALNDGWVPDYSNSSQQKWYPWYKFNKGASGRGLSFYVGVCDHVNALVAPRLVFKSSQLLAHAMKISPETFNSYFNS